MQTTFSTVCKDLTGAGPVSDTDTNENRGAYESVTSQAGRTKSMKNKNQRELCAS